MIAFIRQRVKSFSYAFKGIYTLVSTQAHARIHLLAIVVVSLSGWYFGISASEWCLVVFAFALVLSAEAFNTAVEFIVDLVSPDYHPLAGKAKDVAAAAVLIAAIGAAIIGGIIFVPKIASLWR